MIEQSDPGLAVDRAPPATGWDWLLGLVAIVAAGVILLTEMPL